MEGPFFCAAKPANPEPSYATVARTRTEAASAGAWSSNSVTGAGTYPRSMGAITCYPVAPTGVCSPPKVVVGMPRRGVRPEGGTVNRVRHRWFGAVVGAVAAGVLVVLLATPGGAQSAPPSTKPAAPATPATPGAPGAPTITSATGGNEKAEVTWKASIKQGAAPAAKYEVTPYRGSAAQPSVTVDAPATTATVTGLHNKAKYTFKVTAIDAQGVRSKQSIASTAVTPKGSGMVAWYRRKRYWAVALVVLAALVALGVFFFRRGKKITSAAPAAPSTVPEAS